MPTKPHAREHDHAQQNAAIGGQVMRALGQPGDLHRVEVRPLWEDHYRVNVLVGLDAASVRVAHSYFLVTDGEGTIQAATPPITRHYEALGPGSGGVTAFRAGAAGAQESS